ncbi:MAG TPA: L-2-amino-thiazoline-4-carboxylic acid hydrolase, partial [Bacillota bacterium]|nr:L-2-amino-thiazoline-4-carboxylic acid hydrolase [Bacillota bacterium]
PAIYLQLKEKLDPPDALAVTNEIIIAVSSDVDRAFDKKHGLMKIQDPFQRWQKYRNNLTAEGFGLFNKITNVEVSPERMHYVVSRCIFHDFLTQAGAPEINHFICDYDIMAHGRLFPEFDFSRNGSLENTMGHGNACCHYTWEVKPKPDLTISG